MKSLKYMPFFILILSTGCFNSNSVDIFEGGCPEDNDQAFAITDSDGITEMCLITDLEYDVISWNWSEDGSLLAYELESQKKVCQYTVYTVWFRDSDCGNLTLKNGAEWEFDDEINERGCNFFRESGWGEPEGCPQTIPSGYPPPSGTPFYSYP